MPEFVNDWLSWGAGPRGCSICSSAARPARCSTAGSTSRPTTSRRWPIPVLRHRILTNFTAESSGISPDKVIDRLLEEVPERRAGRRDCAGIEASVCMRTRSRLQRSRFKVEFAS